MKVFRSGSVVVVALAVLATSCEGSHPEFSPGVQARGPRSASAVPDSQVVRRLARQRMEEHLDWADAECRRHLAKSLARLDEFFAEAKQGARPFAEEALGWSSKWRLAVDYVPFTSHDRHPTFLRARFTEHVFTAEQLQDVIEQVVKDYLAAIQDVENQMLVRMRADIEDLPYIPAPAFASDELLRKEFARALAEVQKTVDKELKRDIVSLVASEIASLVAARIAARILKATAVRLSVSGGILAISAKTSWATLGIGLVAGLIVEWIVDKVWDWYADPRGQLVEMLNRNLEQLHGMLLQGDQRHPGLNQELAKLAQDRSALRRAAVFKLLED